MQTDLTAREGKVLRFIVSRSSGIYQQPVAPKQIINKIEWSDLPHSLTQAVFTLTKLRRAGLIEPAKGGYQATESGTELIREADAAKLWRS